MNPDTRPREPYWRRLWVGERADGSMTEHYWRWPVMVRLRPMLGLSWHGIRDGVVRGRGPFHPAVRSFLWIGPLGIEFGWRRQAIENRRWRRDLNAKERS